MSRPLIYRAAGQENRSRTSENAPKARKATKRVKFLSGSTPTRAPLMSRDMNIERRLPTPGKVGKSTGDEQQEGLMSQAYACLRHQYDSLKSEMGHLKESPDRQKASKYHEILEEKQALEEQLREQRDLLLSLLSEFNVMFPDVTSSNVSECANKEEQPETEDDADEAISRYVDQCIGTVAGELRKEKEQKDEVEKLSDGERPDDSDLAGSTSVVWGLPSPIPADGHKQYTTNDTSIIVSPPSQFADKTVANQNEPTRLDVTAGSPTTPSNKDNDTLSSTCSDRWSTCISTPSLVAPPTTPLSSRPRASTPDLTSQLCGKLMSQLNASSFTPSPREPSLVESESIPHTEDTFLSSTNESQDFVFHVQPIGSLNFTDCTPVTRPQHPTPHHQSVQTVAYPTVTVDQSVAMTPLLMADQGTSTSPVTVCDVSMETIPVETRTIGTEMIPPPVNEYEVKYTQLNTENDKLRRDLASARQQIAEMGAVVEEFQLQDRYKECYYVELEKNQVLEDELAAYRGMIEKVEEAERLQVEFAAKIQQAGKVVKKYVEENRLLKDRVELLECQLADGEESLSNLQRRESMLVSEVGKLLVELTGIKSQLQVTQDHLSTQTEKAGKYEFENGKLLADNKKLRDELDTTNQAAVTAVETLQAEVQRLQGLLNEKGHELQELSTHSGETQEFLEAERLTMCEELTTLRSAARCSMLQQDGEMHAVAQAVRLLWDKFHESVGVLSIRSGVATSQQMLALKRRSLLSSGSLVDCVLAGKMTKSVDESGQDWGDETYVGFGHLMGRITNLQERVTELQDLASWKALRERIETVEKEKSELSSELGRCQNRIANAIKALDETKARLERRDEQYKELQDTFTSSYAQQEIQELKEKKHHYKNRLKELIAFGEEYQARMERKVELLKSNLAKAETEAGSLDCIIGHARKTLHVCIETVKTCPKLEKLLKYLDGTLTETC